MLNSFSRAHASELYNCIYKLPASWPKACIELGVAIGAVTGDLKTVPIFKKKKKKRKKGGDNVSASEGNLFQDNRGE